jgi:hypothetical protein
LRVCRFLAKRVCYVLSRESEEDVTACAVTLFGAASPVLVSHHESGGKTTRWETAVERRYWSPADQQAVRRLLDWWSMDAEALSDDGFDEDERDRFLGGAFVLIDLNTGRSLVIVDR